MATRAAPVQPAARALCGGRLRRRAPARAVCRCSAPRAAAVRVRPLQGDDFGAVAALQAAVFFEPPPLLATVPFADAPARALFGADLALTLARKLRYTALNRFTALVAVPEAAATSFAPPLGVLEARTRRRGARPACHMPVSARPPAGHALTRRALRLRQVSIQRDAAGEQRREAPGLRTSR
jgi:hypothetical protein